MTADAPAHDWHVLAHRVNRPPTLHGGFQYAADADDWAERVLGGDAACIGWDLLIRTPVEAVAAVAAVLAVPPDLSARGKHRRTEQATP